MSNITRRVSVVASADCSPTTVGGSVLWAAKAGLVATSCAAAAITPRTVSRSAAPAPGNVRSTMARAQPRERLPMRRMSPLGMTKMVPSTPRKRVRRIVTSSTTPVTPPTVTASPTLYWSSMVMRIPEK